jgi:hypothetical protein
MKILEPSFPLHAPLVWLILVLLCIYVIACCLTIKARPDPRAVRICPRSGGRWNRKYHTLLLRRIFFIASVRLLSYDEPLSRCIWITSLFGLPPSSSCHIARCSKVFIPLCLATFSLATPSTTNSNLNYRKTPEWDTVKSTSLVNSGRDISKNKVSR